MLRLFWLKRKYHLDGQACFKFGVKVWVFWEGHKIWKNLCCTFDKSVVFWARNSVLIIQTLMTLFLSNPKNYKLVFLHFVESALKSWLTLIQTFDTSEFKTIYNFNIIFYNTKTGHCVLPSCIARALNRTLLTAVWRWYIRVFLE